MEAVKNAKEQTREELLIEVFTHLGPCTCNEAIMFLFNRDVQDGTALEKGPFYYTHLNKLPDKLMVKGLIREVGSKIGTSGRREKIWEVIK